MSLSEQELRNILGNGNYPYSSEDAAILHDAQSRVGNLKQQYDSLKEEYKKGEADRKKYDEAKNAVSEGKELDIIDAIFQPLSFAAKKTKSGIAKAEIPRLEAKINSLQSRLDSAETQYNKCVDCIREIQDRYRAQIENQLLELMGYPIPDYNNLYGSISFGVYNNEKIYWDIICREGSKLLLFAERPLFFAPFNTKNEPTVWAISSLRKFLNGEIYQTIFSDSEKSHICKTTVPETVGFRGDKSPQTTDYLFLLSEEEIATYFPNEKNAIRFSEFDEDSGVGRIAAYWLRNPGENTSCGSVLSFSKIAGLGSPIMSEHMVGIPVNDSNGAVCPAMWISL